MTTFPEYRVSPKVLLQHGDKFRASRGPYYVCNDGKKVNMAENGVMTFIDYYEEFGNKVIRASQRGSLVLIVLKRGPRRLVEGIKYRSYRLVKCRAKKEKRA